MTEDHDELPVVDLARAPLGFAIYHDGAHIGGIQGELGHLELLTIKTAWEGQGFARAALRAFVRKSLKEGHETVRAKHSDHAAAQHVMETEDGWQDLGDAGWEYRL
jgi:GNAT superfamily N-acetyltransferase